MAGLQSQMDLLSLRTGGLSFSLNVSSIFAKDGFQPYYGLAHMPEFLQPSPSSLKTSWFGHYSPHTTLVIPSSLGFPRQIAWLLTITRARLQPQKRLITASGLTTTWLQPNIILNGG